MIWYVRNKISEADFNPCVRDLEELNAITEVMMSCEVADVLSGWGGGPGHQRRPTESELTAASASTSRPRSRQPGLGRHCRGARAPSR